ncbi:type I secretion system permease/ATPase [Fuscibacter oryzae]|uniref:Type I secretion system permease/ATPase n=1 Tax=Fuscibacter oryzae TaxID=2803939 RepID=A0A8J7SXL1_9RHOB|nr:type I secretion system permease/ATPase [Fuscibacter oryzae]MBL4930099.1 type I secretion system permease/ATPase [Fuscibacter oryzae]
MAVTEGKAPAPSAASQPELNAYRSALRGMRPPVMAAGFFSALISLLMLTGSLYMLQVYDRVLSSGSVATLQGLFVIVTLAYAFYGLYEFLRARILSRAAMRLEGAVAPVAFRAWLKSGLQGGQGQAQPMRDLEILRGFLSGPAIGGLFDLPWMPLYVLILWLIHPLLGLLTLGGAGVAIVVALVNHWMTRGSADRAMAGDAQARGFADQGQRQAELIEAMGMQADVTARWRELQGASLAANQQGTDVTEATSSFSKAFRNFLQSAMLTLGAWLVLGHQMSAGMIIATSILSGRALAPVDQIIGQWRAISRAAVAHRRLTEFFDRETATPRALRLPAPTGRIEVKALTRLGPPVAGADRKRILTQVSFDLEPGECLGVIGDSAAGKSTLARILVGAWTSEVGEIRLDGALRSHWDPVELGRHIGYLPQMVDMLPGTVRDNISRFTPDATDEAVIEAAKAAGVHDMILALPEGYSTRLGGGLQPLSGGQMQRLGLARAIYGQPTIVVLDEPNSNLDSHGDAALLSVIAGLKARGATVILMTHRAAVLSSADKVLVLAQGAVARYGARDEVLQKVRPVPAEPGRSLPGSNVRPLWQNNLFTPVPETAPDLMAEAVPGPLADQDDTETSPAAAQATAVAGAAALFRRLHARGQQAAAQESHA